MYLFLTTKQMQSPMPLRKRAYKTDGDTGNLSPCTLQIVLIYLASVSYIINEDRFIVPEMQSWTMQGQRELKQNIFFLSL